MKLSLSLAAVAAALLIVLAPAAAASDAHAEVRLAISGMHCEGCAAGITAMLKRTEGVAQADVKYDTREATVQYDAAKTSPEKIMAVIQKMGYKVSVKK